MELKQKEKDLNDIGRLTGAFLGAIPFYLLYKTVTNLGVIYNLCKSLFVKVLLSFILFNALSIYMIFSVIELLSMEPEILYMSYSDFLAGYIFLVFIMILVCVFGGGSIKNYLEQNILQDESVRFELASLSGVYLRAIPFYQIVKSVDTKELVYKYSDKKVSFTAYYIFYVINIFVGGLIKVIMNIIVIFISAGIGYQLKDLEMAIINKNTEIDVE